METLCRRGPGESVLDVPIPRAFTERVLGFRKSRSGETRTQALGDRLIVVGLGLALVILGAVGILNYRATERLIENSRRVKQSHAVLDQIGTLLLEVLQVESASRAYILGGKSFYLEPYYDSLSRIDRTLRNLEQMTAGDARLQSRALALKEPVGRKVAYHQRQVELRARDGSVPPLDAFATGTGHELMDEISRLVDRLKNEEEALLTEEEAEGRLEAQRATYLLAVGSLLSFTILVSVYLHLRKEVSRRQRTQQVLMHLNRLHRILNQVSQTIARVHDRRELLGEVCRIVIKHEALKFVWVGAANERTGLLEPVESAGDAGDFRPVIRMRPDGASDEDLEIIPQLRQGKHFVSDAVRPGWCPTDKAADIGSLAVFPLRIENDLVGVLVLCSDDPACFDSETLSLMDQLASNLSHALEAMEAEAARQRAVEQIRSLNEELEKRVVERTEELGAVNFELALRNQEVERANRLKSEFLANMSHELRTPLNAIIGFSELLAEGKAGALEQKQLRFIGHIRSGAHHLLQLINEILDISKIEAGRVRLEHESFQAAEALAEILCVVGPLAENKRIRIEARIEADLNLVADRTRFKQILYNLLSNAVKFTPESGGVWIDSLREADGSLRFSVRDTGIGIPSGELGAIFEQFHQVGETTKGIREGTGLGLAITKRLVELHGGRLWVESEPGKGSAFFFTIPSFLPPVIERPDENLQLRADS